MSDGYMEVFPTFAMTSTIGTIALPSRHTIHNERGDGKT